MAAAANNVPLFAPLGVGAPGRMGVVAAVAGQAVEVLVTADPDRVRRADRVVLPGVGAFSDCRRGLAGLDGMLDALTETARARARPFLGICVGMQLLATVGHEHRDEPGLDWLAGEVSG